LDWIGSVVSEEEICELIFLKFILICIYLGKIFIWPYDLTIIIYL
jgi:hypothetical protein